MDVLANRGRAPALGALTGLVLVLVVTAALLPFRDEVTRAAALVLVLPVVLAGTVGGTRAALAIAVASAGAFNLAFVKPYWQFKVDAFEDYVALAVLVAVASAVGVLVAAESERRRAAEEREALATGLYQQLQDMTNERERFRDEADRVTTLERIDEQRSALLRSVSHDLRTPLATIRAIASDLRDGVAFDPQTQHELLVSVCDEAQRLDRLVGNLLSMSRIEAGALRPERQAVDVEELLGNRVAALRGLFGDVRVQLEVPDGLPYVDGDYSQLDQVVTNLLENAARYAPPGSTVRVTARAPAPASVVVSISDEGIGVPAWEAARIFEPFRRGEGSHSSGVGLAICKAIVEAHGGTISVDRAPGGGASFFVSLPTREAGTP